MSIIKETLKKIKESVEDGENYITSFKLVKEVGVTVTNPGAEVSPEEVFDIPPKKKESEFYAILSKGTYKWDEDEMSYVDNDGEPVYFGDYIAGDEFIEYLEGKRAATNVKYGDDPLEY